MITIYFITSNKGKFNEVKEKMHDLNISIKQENIGYPEIQANSLEEVADFGATYIREKFHYPFITPIGRILATFRVIPSLCITSTTSETSLYAPGISSAIVL